MAMFLKEVKKFNTENEPITLTVIMGHNITIKDVAVVDRHGYPISDNSNHEVRQRVIDICDKGKIISVGFEPNLIDEMITDLLSWTKQNKIDIE
jgi:hypothetical protein